MNFSQIIKSPLVLYGSTQYATTETDRCVQTSEWMTPPVLQGENPPLIKQTSFLCTCVFFFFLHTSHWHQEAFNHVYFLSSTLNTPGVSSVCAGEPGALHQREPADLQELCAQHH